MLGKIEGRRRRGQQRMASPTQWPWVWVGDGQGSLVCCSPWSYEESDTTERLNWRSPPAADFSFSVIQTRTTRGRKLRKTHNWPHGGAVAPHRNSGAQLPESKSLHPKVKLFQKMPDQFDKRQVPGRSRNFIIFLYTKMWLEFWQSQCQCMWLYYLLVLWLKKDIWVLNCL